MSTSSQEQYPIWIISDEMKLLHQIDVMSSIDLALEKAGAILMTLGFSTEDVLISSHIDDQKSEGILLSSSSSKLGIIVFGVCLIEDDEYESLSEKDKLLFEMPIMGSA